MSEQPDEFISALLRTESAAVVDLDSAYARVTRRAGHVRRRRAVVVSGAACVALFGSVVFAGSRMGAPDDVQPGGPSTDQRGNLVPDASPTAAVTSTTVVILPRDVTSTVPTLQAVVVTEPESPESTESNSASTSPSSGPGNGGPNTTDDHGDDDQSDDSGPTDTSDDGHSIGDDNGHDDDHGGSEPGDDEGRDGDTERDGGGGESLGD